MKAVLRLLVGVVSIAFPFLWYWGRAAGFFHYLAALMGVLWFVRGMLQHGVQRRISWLIAAFFAAVLVFKLPESMYWYPVIVSGVMLAWFGSSLFARQTVIERLARLRLPDLPPAGVRYTRRVTQIWCVFFLVNGSISATLALWGNLHWWTWYTGAVSYVLMGLLFAGELLYRYCVIRPKAHHDHLP